MSRITSPSLARPAAAAPTVLATITAIPDQLDLSAVTLSIAVTVNGSPVTPDAVAWRVNAATTGIADATATPTTHTPTDGGVHVVTCAVTVDGIVYYAEAESYTVGIAASDGGHWVPDWELDPATAADHDFKVGPLTHDGVTLTLDGTATVAGITAGVMTIQPTGPGDVFLWALGDKPSAKLGRDFCWMVAFGANLTANNDGIFILYGNSGTTVYGFAEARNVSGVQKVDMQRAGLTPQQDSTAGGGQVRILGLRMAGQYGMQCVYSETAISGGSWPAPTSMSKHDKVPSGWYTLDDSSPADSADSLAAATDRVRVVQVRGSNARSYTITRLARLVRA